MCSPTASPTAPASPDPAGRMAVQCAAVLHREGSARRVRRAARRAALRQSPALTLRPSTGRRGTRAPRADSAGGGLLGGPSGGRLAARAGRMRRRFRWRAAGGGPSRPARAPRSPNAWFSRAPTARSNSSSPSGSRPPPGTARTTSHPVSDGVGRPAGGITRSPRRGRRARREPLRGPRARPAAGSGEGCRGAGVQVTPRPARRGRRTPGAGRYPGRARPTRS